MCFIQLHSFLKYFMTSKRKFKHGVCEVGISAVLLDTDNHRLDEFAWKALSCAFLVVERARCCILWPSLKNIVYSRSIFTTLV